MRTAVDEQDFAVDEGTLDQIVEYPAHWMPPNRSYWCQYLADWVSVKKKWGLAMDIKEVDAIKKGRKVCKKYKSGGNGWEAMRVG